MFTLRRVVGHSMEPILKSGRVVLALKSKNFRRGDIVISEYKGKEVIKFVRKFKKNEVYLAGAKAEHDIGWVDKLNVKARLVWPRS